MRSKYCSIPDSVLTTDGNVIFTGQDIRDGQKVWQSIGGHQLGSVWGHGSYVAPDWSADWLHREAVMIADRFAQSEYGQTYEELNDERKARTGFSVILLLAGIGLLALYYASQKEKEIPTDGFGSLLI